MPKGATIDKGTVVRITLDAQPNATPVVTSEQLIAKGFSERTEPEALVVGPRWRRSKPHPELAGCSD